MNNSKFHKKNTQLYLDNISQISGKNSSGPARDRSNSHKVVSPVFSNQHDFQKRTGLPFRFTRPDDANNVSKDVIEWNDREDGQEGSSSGEKLRIPESTSPYHQ